MMAVCPLFHTLFINAKKYPEFFDPAELCPYCDEPWPVNPSEKLQEARRNLDLQSYPDSEYAENPLHRSVPGGFVKSISVCMLHRFEAHTLREAQLNGWPMQIDFDGLYPRVVELIPQVRPLITHPTTSEYYWLARKLYNEVGSTAAQSIMGQYQDFESYSAGYYGEVGARIIRLTLEIYITDEIPPPLSHSDFLDKVLLPEIAVRLIQEDMGLPRDMAIGTVSRSRLFGLGMYPDDDGEAGSFIVKKIAEVYRKDLQKRGEFF